MTSKWGNLGWEYDPDKRLREVRATEAEPASEYIAYMCPFGCGCLWRDNYDGTMSLFGPNSKSCIQCEVLPLTELIPLYKRVTATQAQPEGVDWKPDSMHANATPFLGTCETPHFLGEPTPDRKALTQIPHYALPQNLCKNWKPVASAPTPDPRRSLFAECVEGVEAMKERREATSPDPEPLSAERRLTKAAFYSQVGGSLVIDLNTAIEIAEESLTAAQAELQRMRDEFKAKSENAYCDYIAQMRRDPCLGWEIKTQTGRFGKNELDAHIKAAEQLGRHHAFAEAEAALRTQGGEAEPKV